MMHKYIITLYNQYLSAFCNSSYLVWKNNCITKLVNFNFILRYYALLPDILGYSIFSGSLINHSLVCMKSSVLYWFKIYISFDSVLYNISAAILHQGMQNLEWEGFSGCVPPK